MDFDEPADKEAEMGTAMPQSYESISDSARLKMGPRGGEGASTATPTRTRKPGAAAKYRECLKNHAVSIGGHAVDGCREFMAAGNEGTLDALKCAACNCHRNFHRKDTGGGEEVYHYHHPQFSSYYHAPLPAGYFPLAPPPQQYRPLAPPPASGGGCSSGGPGVGHMREDEDMSNPSSSGGGGASGSSKKRFRTKFTQEQKDKMLEFAERLGWRIQKHDEAAVEKFCAENGVRRRVLKVWMRNSKHTLGKKP